MDIQTRRILVKHLAKKYQKAIKREKSKIISELVDIVGYNRAYARYILRIPSKHKQQRRKKISRYKKVFSSLKTLWAIANFACGKRLKPILPTYLAALRRHKELVISSEEKRLLLQVSSATIDRLLVHERKRVNINGRSRTKPGTLLKSQIPIKMWTGWDNTRPGFVEIDSVHHCGTSLYGDYLYTLDLTDVASGWNECCAHLGRGEYRTIQALETIRRRLPFLLLGIDFDCGGEFVNYHLIRYCTKNQITYTRAREGVKNDQSYVEQQNYSVVRRFVGYQRLDSEKHLKIVNKLYELLSDYQNFFQPVMRLKTKVRDGAKVTRVYDTPRTAYQRILKRKEISEEIKQSLTVRYLKLNPKKLILEITALGKSLFKE